MYVVIYLISMNLLLLLLISMRKGYARMKRNFRENMERNLCTVAFYSIRDKYDQVAPLVQLRSSWHFLTAAKMSLQFYKFSRYSNILKLTIAVMSESAEATLSPMQLLF